MRLLVCGDRWWDNYNKVEQVLRRIQEVAKIECLIEGGCKGADEWAFFAYIRISGNPKIFEFLPEWQKYGDNAGPIRNQEMIDEGKPDLVVAFHNEPERSRGTKDMIRRAKRANIPVILIREETQIKGMEEICQSSMSDSKEAG